MKCEVPALDDHLKKLQSRETLQLLHDRHAYHKIKRQRIGGSDKLDPITASQVSAFDQYTPDNT